MTTSLVGVALGASTLVLLLGMGITSWIRSQSPDHWVDQSWLGTMGTVCATIPRGGVGKIVHHRLGVRSSLAARMYDDASVARAGDEVVIVEVRDGIALVSPTR